MKSNLYLILITSPKGPWTLPLLVSKLNWPMQSCLLNLTLVPRTYFWILKFNVLYILEYKFYWAYTFTKYLSISPNQPRGPFCLTLGCSQSQEYFTDSRRRLDAAKSLFGPWASRREVVLRLTTLSDLGFNIYHRAKACTITSSIYVKYNFTHMSYFFTRAKCKRSLLAATSSNMLCSKLDSI